MFRALILATGLAGVLAFSASAAEDDKKPERPARRQQTEEQKALMKEIREKYDKDKDGRLSPEERKGISEEDKAKMEKAGVGPRRRNQDPK
jgi:hypothetical protein